MSDVKRHQSGSLKHGNGFAPCEPLYKRAPSRDADGRPLPDFMMIIPRLSKKPQQQIAETLRVIESTLRSYGDAVVFADMNLKLNILWVTVRPVPGICLELPAIIKHNVPEALLVASKHD